MLRNCASFTCFDRRITREERTKRVEDGEGVRGEASERCREVRLQLDDLSEVLAS